MKNRFMMAAFLSVVLAVGAPLANALMTAQKFRDYPSFRVKIEPYDPRDLFYGQYLQFQTTWNWKEGGAKPAYGLNCLCVGEGEIEPQVSLTLCPPKGETPKDCRFVLRGQSHGNSRFDVGVHRYYVDETLAKPLENLFLHEKQNFGLDLHVTPEGRVMPGELYIEGESLKDFVARQREEIPQIKDAVTP